ncbi:MAG: hypothetical protein ACYDCL_13375 [Myxococcales bacterium]
MKPSFSKVDLDAALDEVGPHVKRAFELSHEALAAAGIPHVVVGGIAVNAYGHHYSTKDVDYLVDPADAFDGSVVLTHKQGVPFEVAGVPIDYVTGDPGFPAAVRTAIKENIEAARSRSDQTLVVQDWLLVWLKLNAGRTKDLAAVEGLIQAGLDVESVREALSEAGPKRVVDLFERCVGNAEA